jgi:putative ABC transport system permease protein
MLVTGANDRDGTQKIFTSLSSTIGTIENVVLITTTIMVILIVMLVSIMIIDDSKRLAATLKALGYSDKENILTFLSIYIPVILIGLAIGIPLSFGIVYAFQAIVFHSASILLSASIP